MQNVLADLALESEAATALMLRLARAFEAPPGSAGARLRAHRHRRREVLGVQAHPAGHRRGDGVPRRQRLRRGVDPPAPLPRGPGERDLGGLAATSSASTCCAPSCASPSARRRCSTSCASRAAATAGSTRGSRSSKRSCADPADAELRARRTVERIALAVQASAAGAVCAAVRGGCVLCGAARGGGGASRGCSSGRCPGAWMWGRWWRGRGRRARRSSLRYVTRGTYHGA